MVPYTQLHINKANRGSTSHSISNSCTLNNSNMMYQLLPFFAACSTVLHTLPIEVWCLILRKLDRKSLLATVRSLDFLNFVVQGDLLLRENVKQAIKEENEECLSYLTRPGMSAAVTRKERAQLFGTNGEKRVSVRKSPETLHSALKEKTRKSMGKVLKSTGKINRFKPYRI